MWIWSARWGQAVAKVQIRGIRAAQERLLTLPDEVAEHALRSSAYAGADLLKDEVVARAPRKSGRLKRAIYTKHLEEHSSRDKQAYRVGVRRGRKRKSDKDDGPDDMAFYAAWIEYGHWHVPPKADGTPWKAHRAVHAGKKWVPAKPFIRPSFEAKRAEAVRAMKERLKQRLNEILSGKK
nr:HK97 gp10 family phage protein [Cupriavidus basilensis]